MVLPFDQMLGMKDRAIRLRVYETGVVVVGGAGRGGDERAGEDSMSAFCRSESGRPGRLAPFSFPRESVRRDRPRELAALFLLIAYSQRLRVPLICSLTSQTRPSIKNARAPVYPAHGLYYTS
jgi:hypothetical protein